MKKEDGSPAGSRKELFIPLIFSAAVIILDQLTKQLVVANIPAWSVGAEFFGGAFRIIHVYNPGAAFPWAADFPARCGVLFSDCFLSQCWL